ncbi:SIMPL domain-containing protein [Patescibacteria group bacterium]
MDEHHQYKHKHKHKLLAFIIFIITLLAGIRFMPWHNVNWGKFEMLPGSAITVTGEGKLTLKNQIARFSATIHSTHEDKQQATEEVNQTMEEIIQQVKDFGIPEKDIQTQHVSVYKQEKPRVLIYPAPEIDTDDNKWRASNSIEIILRNVDQASDLANLLQSSKATGVNGPRFSLDDTDDSEQELLTAAINDAREKAEVIAKASNRKLGKVLTVSESGSSPNIFRAMMPEAGGGGEMATDVPVEPGSTKTTKTVTVVFELK